MAKETTYELDLLRLPENGLLTPEAALKWLAEEHDGYQQVAIETAGADDGVLSADERLAGWYLGKDLAAMVQACAEALQTGKAVAVTRSKWSVAGEQCVRLARLLASMRVFDDGMPCDSIAEAYGKLTAELVQQLTSSEGLEAIERLDGASAPPSP